MKKIRKNIKLLCALIATLTLTTFASCMMNNTNTSSQASSSENSISTESSSISSIVESSSASDESVESSTVNSSVASSASESSTGSSASENSTASSADSSVQSSTYSSDESSANESSVESANSSQETSSSVSSEVEPVISGYTFIVLNYNGSPAENVNVQLCTPGDSAACFAPMLTDVNGKVEYAFAGFVEGEYEIHLFDSTMTTSLAFTGESVTPAIYCDIILTLQNAPRWSAWEVVSQPTCTEDGEKSRYHLDDPTNIETAPIAARGHNYSKDSGTCVDCGDQAQIPALEIDQAFPLAEPCIHDDEQISNGLCDCAYKGRGEEYSRLELTEGCYTIETMKNLELNNAIWLSFSIKEAGQYMLYSVDNNGVATATRHDASMAFVSPVGENARVDENGDFYSYVSCTEQYFSEYWRATFCINAKAGTLVKICFVKIADPVWAPKSAYTYVYPTEINGKKAPEGGAGYKKTDVPYDSAYYYSDPATGGDGYYHLATGEIIFAAINSSPNRLLAGGVFNSIHYEGSALNLPDGYTADGDYNVLNYVPFIMNCMYNDDIFATDESGNLLVNPNKNCYQNYCNSDGLYPVNAELFKFLNLYVQKNQPIDAAVSDEDWANQEDWLWLSACYFYAPLNDGIESNPLLLTVGEYEINLPEADFYYCKITEAGTYKITCSDSEVLIGDNYETGSVTFVVTADSPVVFTFASMEKTTVTITVEKIEDEV